MPPLTPRCEAQAKISLCRVLQVFSEILRVLKPGQVFACYEWCLTDKYDKTNEEHRRIKKQVRMHNHHKRHSTSAGTLARRVAASVWPGEPST